MIVFQGVHLAFGEYARLSLRYMLRTQPLRLLLVLVPAASLGYWLVEVWHGGYSLYKVAQEQRAELLFMVLVFMLLPFLLWRGLKRNYNSSKLLQASATYSFDAAGIRTDARSVQSVLTWDNAIVAYRLPPYAILMVNAVNGYFLDFRRLEPPGTEDDFWQLLRQHGVKCK